MDPVTVLFPTEAEAAPFRALAPAGVRIAICGVGMAECAAAAAAAVAAGARRLVLAGVAGAYPGSGIGKGEAVWVEREHIADLGAMRRTETEGGGSRTRQPHCGEHPEAGLRFVPLYTEFYSADWEFRAPLKRAEGHTVDCAGGAGVSGRTGIENMEGAAFFAVCAALGVRSAQVRGISNLVGEARSQWCIGAAAEAAARALIDVLGKEPER